MAWALLGVLFKTDSIELRGLGLPVLCGISLLRLISFREQLMMAVRFGAAIAMLVGVYVGLMAHTALRGADLMTSRIGAICARC
jgi:hypothetical protein